MLVRAWWAVHPCAPLTCFLGFPMSSAARAFSCFADVLASAKGTPVGAKPKEEGMYEQLLNTKEFVRLDCWRDKFNYFVTTDGNAKNLRFKLQGKLGGEATTDPQDKDGIVDHNLQDILKQDRMKVVKGSYKLTVTSDKDIGIGLREDSK